MDVDDLNIVKLTEDNALDRLGVVADNRLFAEERERAEEEVVEVCCHDKVRDLLFEQEVCEAEVCLRDVFIPDECFQVTSTKV